MNRVLNEWNILTYLIFSLFFKAKMFLFKPSNGSRSQPVNFNFYPDRKILKAKSTITNVTMGLTQNEVILQSDNPILSNLIKNSTVVPPVL